MHELSIAQNIIDIVEHALPPGSDSRASTIRLRIGELAGVVEDSLVFCFGAITPGTRLEDARLEIARIATTAECRSCGAVHQIIDAVFVCAGCGGTGLTLLSGRELEVVEVELREAEEKL